jgi:protoporphyrinogen oxidase
LYERAAKSIENNKGKVLLKTSIKRVLLDGNSKKVYGVELNDGVIIEADYIVSTMPLTNLVKGFDNAPPKVDAAINSLYFRNTILVYFEINEKNLFADNWLYIHSPNVKLGRITNFRNWCPTLNKGKETTILALEYWCFEEDKLWSQKEDYIVNLAKTELLSINLTHKVINIINSKVIKVPKCYPVYETGYQENLDIVINYLKNIENLFPIGRYGSFKYNNQDHSILMGLLAAKKIMNNSPINLWDINTDTEYQEEGKIKDVLI